MPLSPKRVRRIPPQALYFDGVDDYVVVPHSGLFNSPEATLEVFVSVSSLLGRWQVITTKWDGNVSHEEYVLGVDYNGYLYTIHRNALGSRIGVTDGKAVAGVWYGLAMVYKADSFLRLYVNTSKYETTYTGTMYYQTGPLYIGQRGDNLYFFPGYIAYVRLYSRALTDDEITWNYNYPDNPIRNGLVLWLHWDSIDPVAGVWYDKSGFGNHGTIYGATLVKIVKPPRRVLTPSRVLAPRR